MEFNTYNQEQEMLSWSRVPELQMGQLIHTLLPHPSEAPRTKASAALGACPSESSVGLIMGGVGSVMSLQPWGPVLLSLQWVWLWEGVGSVISLWSWGACPFEFSVGFDCLRG